MKLTSPDSLSGLKRRQSLLYLLIFSLVTIIIWAAFNIFRSQKSEPIPNELLKLARELNPSIDTSVIDALSRKKLFSEAELNNFPIYTIVTDSLRQEILVTIDQAKEIESEKQSQIVKLRAERLVAPTPEPTPETGITPVSTSNSQIQQ